MERLSLQAHVSRSQQADALEAFELRLKQNELDDANAQIDTLKEQLQQQARDHVSEISQVKHSLGGDPLEQIANQLAKLPLLEKHNADLQRVVSELEAMNAAAEQEADDYTTAIKTQDDALKLLRTRYDESQAALKDAVRQLENTGIVLQRDKQLLKELNALNPKKLQTQNKNLQAKNKELNEGKARDKKMLSSLKKENEALERSLSTLRKQKEAIDAGFAKLHADINAGTATDVLQTLGDWQICSHATRHDAFYIVDMQTDIVRPYFNGEIPKARAIPQAVKDATLIISERNKTAAKNLDFLGAGNG